MIPLVHGHCCALHRVASGKISNPHQGVEMPNFVMHLIGGYLCQHADAVVLHARRLGLGIHISGYHATLPLKHFLHA